MRKDAQERRDQLVQAAAQLFRTEGYRVPLEAVAARAGVGRGTLYRNFKDRRALAMAVFDSQMAEVEELSRQDNSDEAIFTLMIAMAERNAALRQIAMAVHVEAGQYPFAELVARLEDIMTKPLERAKKSGIFRPEISPQDVVDMVIMLAANATRSEGITRNDAIGRSLEWIKNGVTL